MCICQLAGIANNVHSYPDARAQTLLTEGPSLSDPLGGGQKKQYIYFLDLLKIVHICRRSKADLSRCGNLPVECLPVHRDNIATNRLIGLIMGDIGEATWTYYVN